MASKKPNLVIKLFVQNYRKFGKYVHWKFLTGYAQFKGFAGVTILLMVLLPTILAVVSAMCPEPVVTGLLLKTCRNIQTSLSELILSKVFLIQAIGLGIALIAKALIEIQCPAFARNYSTSEAESRNNLPKTTQSELAEELRKFTHNKYADDIVDSIRQLAEDVLPEMQRQSPEFLENAEKWSSNPSLAVNAFESWTIRVEHAESLTMSFRELAYYQKAHTRIGLFVLFTLGILIVYHPVIHKASGFLGALVNRHLLI